MRPFAIKCSTTLVLFIIFSTASAQLVLPGDYPDPSVTKAGKLYWASATTSNWGPVFPLLCSSDLINWQTRGFVFNTLPSWADYYFWAPEISFEGGVFYVYYSAHKKGGNLCLGVARADKAEGPYTDLGPVMCQEVGSIDAFPIRDENGKLHLVWKEDGNSVGKPTPIWISEMKEDRTALVGEKRELFRNDLSWEGNLVEGVSMMRHGEYYYAFYAAAACCGEGCNYASGVARSKTLYGPWEKYDKNPLLVDDPEWKCPGHGTPVEKDGKHYFLYHAYQQEGGVYTGRQGLLREFQFTPDGWIAFSYPDRTNPLIAAPMEDNFKGKRLGPDWQWPVLDKPSFSVEKGRLVLYGAGLGKPAFVGQKILSPDFTATTAVVAKQSLAGAGIAAIGDENNIITMILANNVLTLRQIKNGKDSVLIEKPVTVAEHLHLRMRVNDGKELFFLWSSDGNNFQPLNERPVDGSFLPPWDRAVRAGLTSRGDKNLAAVFDYFILDH